MKKWLKRIGLSALLLVVVLLVGASISFAVWSSQHARDLESQSTVIQTQRGPIEYAETGQGTPILIVHGTPGGYDQSLGAIRASGLDQKGYRFILPSRPGYLRTPLSVGETPQEQAQAMAALLTALDVNKVVVLAGSGGGPSALQFALQFPERCSALILEEARTHRPEHPTPPQQASVVFDFVMWVNVALSRDAQWQALNPSDPHIAEVARSVMNAYLPSASRAAGVTNDLKQAAQMEEWSLSQIKCPTLILHGTADTNVPIADAEYAHAQIPGSEFVKLEGADHMMIITRHQELDNLIEGFLTKHARM